MRAQARPQSHVPSCRCLGTAKLSEFVAGAMVAAAAAGLAGIFTGAFLDRLARTFEGGGSTTRGVDAPVCARVSGKLSLRNSFPSSVVGVMIAAV